jgi:hypothetical protein
VLFCDFIIGEIPRKNKGNQGAVNKEQQLDNKNANRTFSIVKTATRPFFSPLKIVVMHESLSNEKDTI